MSKERYLLVGYFDARTVDPNKLLVTRALEPALVAGLLSEYPASVVKHVILQEGYARCVYASGGDVSQEAVFFAYRLAQQVGCLVVAWMGQVMYPPEAAREQGEEWERLYGFKGAGSNAEHEARQRLARIMAEQRTAADGGRVSGSS
jgi:hypothetical protein